jgi:hypothetical protein
MMDVHIISGGLKVLAIIVGWLMAERAGRLLDAKRYGEALTTSLYTVAVCMMVWS